MTFSFYHLTEKVYDNNAYFHSNDTNGNITNGHCAWVEILVRGQKDKKVLHGQEKDKI